MPLKKLVAYNLEEFIKLSREGVAYEPTPKPKRVRFSTQDVASEPYLDLFVPSPPGLAKEEAHEFHITTRNLIAWVVGRPIVGVCLGKALIDLVERLKLYRPDHRRNKIQVTKYAISQGYTNYKDDAEHSLGILNFAEHIEDEKLWREAFVHCVGMRDRLNDSLQYKVRNINFRLYKHKLKWSTLVSKLQNNILDQSAPPSLGPTNQKRQSSVVQFLPRRTCGCTFRPSRLTSSALRCIPLISAYFL